MNRIRKLQFGGLDLNYGNQRNPLVNQSYGNLSIQNILQTFKDGTGGLASIHSQTRSGINPINNNTLAYDRSPVNKPVKIDKNTLSTTSKTNQLAGAGIDAATNLATNYISNKLFDDSDVGRSMGALFSSGVGAAGNTITENLIKGNALSENLGQNIGAALEGTALGITGNLVGQGIDSLGGHTALSRGIGAGVSSTIGQSKSIYDSIKTLNNISKASKAADKLTDTQKAAQLGSKANLWGAGMSIAGSAIGAAAGPSKEYGGKYGSAVKTADTIYDIIQAGVGFIGPVGAIVSGAMALNKGLGNVFGSTDGMTMQDAILGSAFTPAPFKWLNMANASTTGTFNNQSWQNSMKANSFMGNAFGNLNDKFDKARAEAGKTYGTFSQSARRKADDNINFANYAWNKILNMADQNELQNIRSQYMSSINNQRYAQNIQGGWSPIARGKMGMKIFNNATNHNIGMRLLSGAALIDNKQIILSRCIDLD